MITVQDIMDLGFKEPIDDRGSYVFIKDKEDYVIMIFLSSDNSDLKVHVNLTLQEAFGEFAPLDTERFEYSKFHGRILNKEELITILTLLER